MNVHHPQRKSAQEFSLENAHEPRQGHQINFTRQEPVDKSPLCLLIELSAKLSRGNGLGRQSALARPLQNAGLEHVAQNQRHFGRDFSGQTGVGNGCHIRAFARTEHSDTKFSLTTHPLVLQIDALARKLLLSTLGETAQMLDTEKLRSL